MINRVKNLWQDSLRRKLIFAVAGVHAVLMSLFVWDLTARQAEHMHNDQLAQAKVMAQSLAASSAGWLASRDVAGLQEIAEAQRRYPEMTFALLLDRQGLILAHTDRARLGQFVRDMPATPDLAVLGNTQELVDIAAPAFLAGQHVGWVRVGLGNRLATERLSSITRNGILYTLLAIASGILFASIMATGMTSRLQVIRRVSEDIEEGKRDERVPALGRDEIGKLGADFNSMLSVLEAREKQLRHEIAERQKTEDSLRLHSAALEAAANMIFITDRDSVILWANPAVANHTGYTLKEMLGRKPRELFKSGRHDEAFYRHLWTTIMAGKVWRGEMINRRKDGSLYEEDMVITPLLDKAGEVTHFVSVKQDITERKASVQALRESEERYALVVRATNDGIWDWNVLAGETYFSPRWKKILGYQVDELTSQEANFFDRIHPEDKAPVAVALRAHFEKGARYELELRLRHKDGGYRWVFTRGEAIRDATGRPIRMVGSMTDITERKQLEEQYLRAQRMEAIGTLASGLAHDLNNILAPMLMGASFLKKKLADPHDRDLLALIEQSAQRGANIIGQLLAFSRGAEGVRGPIQVRHLLKEVAQIMRETFPKNISIEVDTPGDLWSILGDPTQIHQILLNLCVNARDAMPGGGTLTLRSGNHTLAPGDSRLHLHAQPGRYIRIEVEDTGHGIPPEIMQRIFDPFFTTKGAGKGTGLGLSTALGIAKGHQGFINVVSQPGGGACFGLYLPATADAPGAGDPARVTASPHGNQELILVADDEKFILRTIRLLLEAQGYWVLTAESGDLAIRLLIQNLATVNLLITDMMMPGMEGITLIKAARAVKPGLPVIPMSGLEQETWREHLATLGVAEFVPKPCEPARLIQAVHTALQSPSGGPAVGAPAANPD